MVVADLRVIKSGKQGKQWAITLQARTPLTKPTQTETKLWGGVPDLQVIP